jgi:hypothetical protein
MTVAGQRGSIASQFVREIVDGVRRERSSEVAAAAQTVLLDAGWAHEGPSEETAAYLALCERAWLRWSRLALEDVATGAFGQASLGPSKPASVRDAGEAGQAAVRCDLHRRILDLAPASLPHHEWPWRLEAARQIHVCTRKALIVAASIDPHSPPSPTLLYQGVSQAADALVTVIAARIVADGAREVRETVEGMLVAAEHETSRLIEG